MLMEKSAFTFCLIVVVFLYYIYVYYELEAGMCVESEKEPGNVQMEKECAGRPRDVFFSSFFSGFSLGLVLPQIAQQWSKTGGLLKAV